MKIEYKSNKNKDDESLLNDFQKKAIDEALEDVENGKVQSHQDVMEEIKKDFLNCLIG